MAPRDINDRSLAVELQRLIDRRIDGALRTRQFEYRYGVASGDPDTVKRTISVQLMGLSEPSPGFVYGAIPPRDGDFVRVVIGPRGDRFIWDALGRDVPQEIIDVVTPPVVQPDRATGATIIHPAGGLPLLLAEKGGWGTIILDAGFVPPDGALIVLGGTARIAATPGVPAGFTDLHGTPSMAYGVRVCYRIASGEVGAGIAPFGSAYGLTGTATNQYVRVYAPGTTIGQVVWQDFVAASTPVDCGGPITPSQPNVTIIGYAANDFFSGFNPAVPDAGITTLRSAPDPTGNPPTLWVADIDVVTPAPTSVSGDWSTAANWYGVTVEVLGGTGDDVLVPAPEAVDHDDATYHASTTTEAIRLDLGAAYRITRARIVLAAETAGAKTYTIRGANEGDFSDEVTLASMSFTAAGAYAANVLTPVWPSTTPYRFWRIVGPAETRRVHSVELYETTAGATPVTDPTTGTGADIDDALAAILALIVGGYQPLDSDLTAFAALAIAADTLPYGTGSHTLGLTGLSAFIRTLLDDPDQATARATLGITAAAALDDLTDVTITTPAIGDRLRWNGTAWVNTTLTWKGLMAAAPNIVTTDGSAVYLPLTTVDGEPLIAEVPA